MALMKTDAHGHRDVNVATVLQSGGVSDFVVSNITKAISLRKEIIRRTDKR